MNALLDLEPKAKENWLAHLELRFQQSNQKTFIERRRHEGPLRILKPFYPEDGVCHVYLIHPPGGVAGGDQLLLDIHLGDSADSLLTTPGATKIYRTLSEQHSEITQSFSIAENAKLEWLPMETIVFPGATGKIKSKIECKASSSWIGWEIYCFGRPSLQESFTKGNLFFDLEIWQENRPILIDKLDLSPSTIHSITGLRGNPVFGTLWAYPANEAILEEIHFFLESCEGVTGGATRIDSFLVIRALSTKTHLIKECFLNLWKKLRPALLQKPPIEPRIWST